MAVLQQGANQNLEATTNDATGDSLNVQAVRRAYEAFDRGDIPAVLSMFDEQVEWNMAEHHTFWPGGPFVGPQAVLEGVFSRIMQTFQDFTVTVQRIIGFGDTVLVELRYRARSRATGKALQAQGAHIFDFRDDRCVRYQQYTDTWQFAEVTGVVPSEERSPSAP